MQLQTAKHFVMVGEELDIEISLLEEYSGRGMVGRKTAGICIDSSGDLNILIFHLGFFLGFAGHDSEETKEDIQNLHIDQLGKGYIVY